MPFVISDKASGDLHTLHIDEPDACLKIKQRLLRTTDFAAYSAKQLYVHVPYCFFHCSFCVYRGELLRHGGQTHQFLVNIQAEIAALKPLVCDITFHSVFVGGGTVTVLDAAQLRSLLELLKVSFATGVPTGEFTVELAPHGLTTAKLDVLTALGANRVTMGLQSLDEALLRSMNRPRIPEDRLKSTIDAIHARPFADANFDLMVGIPGRTYENLLADFRQLAQWGCRSIMIYIDMRAYRDSLRQSEVARAKAMVERLAMEFIDSYTLNSGNGVNEYNRFLSRDRGESSAFASRYSTDYWDNQTFCLGIGRHAKSWNRDMIFHWH